ncbi:hypothetical protein J437_LFUL013639 [Ladona fulva]|uniref:Uncharacterized protein n=1 Tax=Ladona fulva TaxID=123851 RepID=A0A8K0KJE0_LADFU|nr:hypothetical protein J437_LFUL013639 [Ladona fulva]
MPFESEHWDISAQSGGVVAVFSDSDCFLIDPMDAYEKSPAPRSDDHCLPPTLATTPVMLPRRYYCFACRYCSESKSDIEHHSKVLCKQFCRNCKKKRYIREINENNTVERYKQRTQHDLWMEVEYLTLSLLLSSIHDGDFLCKRMNVVYRRWRLSSANK